MDAPRRVTRAFSAQKLQEQQQNESPQQSAVAMGEDGEGLMTVSWPENGALTLEWVQKLGKTLDFASRNLLPSELPTVLPVSVIDSLLLAAHKILHREANCVEVPVDLSCKAVLVGDVHGQFHDVLHLLEIAGSPSANRLFVFNGDYVDRGAWGFETYFYLLAWKLLLPHRVFLLRGNHETKFCTSAYGFEQEVASKFGDRSKHVYRKLLGCFEGHPLAARVAGCVYMAHGGLFRQVEIEPPKKTKGKSYRRLLSGRNAEKALKLGTLDDLAKARRMVLDPSGFGTNVIPGDVLWSDPSPENGLSHNDSRGIGLFFGPDCTQEFMEKHKLKLIVRSHEGPDARDKRPEMDPMNKGYTIDHVVKAGKLITLFSAPDYPQFQASGERYNNKGAYIVLEAPDFSTPHFFEFEAVQPRPKVTPYYDFVNSIDSDEELDLGSGSGSEGSCGSGSGSDKET
ncbi:serine/threonine-protein phosphatase 7 isoform X2 [Physcomitrium patens]|uniref:Serine/threonine-protein phosphatase n=1 Tax=Physcomitrium patens TaxID=3218 RepID=A0A2K1JDQ9_PHYPA|nr:serine/threonine-protein phosphatase 7-like isoform X2 [Physcomitrium patens]PNR39663.1 hypothetical protein PHYPA_019942 [Physcomitrium patens]|eukprot:XP_024396295.1 serine/threonine-protein phosphatase 7-like isoform X2 [Physcomitrella patens]